MADTSISNQVYLSRNEIRNQIISYLQSYLELENVDLTKSSFLSFIVDILAALTSNIMFYQISAYREFFMTTAQLPESVLNLSAFLGYDPSNATPATVNVLFTVPLEFTESSVSFTIPSGFTVKAGTIEFKTYYSTAITVANNSSITVTVTEGNRVYDWPVTTDDDNFYISLPMRQLSTDQQEFQIDADLQTYQFSELEVSVDGQVSSVTVEVQEGSGFTTYTEYSSLFLMDSNDKGYVRTRTDDGFTITFGNGLIGAQPPAGATVRITSEVTEGIDGNVIASSITTGDRIYDGNKIVNYSVTNTSAATGGGDQESIEEIRSNSIANLTALSRIVTESDFQNADVIISDSPLGANSLPILKRSDLKVNEVNLYTTINYNDEIVPTRSVYSDFMTTTIPRQTVITFQDIDYYTLFDMEIDPTNSVADYSYIIFSLDQIPTLSTTYSTDYNIQATNLTVSRSGQSAIYELDYSSTETQIDGTSAICTMEIVENGAVYTMTNDTTGSVFTYTFSNYLAIPSGELTYRFTIKKPDGTLVSQYSAQFTFRRDLSDFSISDAIYDGTSAYTVYDIPVVRKSYYDSINQAEFESQILQALVSTVTFADYKMLTDFINLKFGNTTGLLTNMLLNTVTQTVIDIECEPPSGCSSGDKYIVGKGKGSWEGQDDSIATCVDGTSWTFAVPNPDVIVSVTNKGTNYIYSDRGWVVPQYNIPLTIEVHVFKDSSYSGSISDLTQDVRTAIYNAFSSTFGINTEIYKSEIINVVQDVDGVENCRVVQPASNIFFNYDIDSFSQLELLRFSPDYVYFTEDNISIKVFS